MLWSAHNLQGPAGVDGRWSEALINVVAAASCLNTYFRYVTNAKAALCFLFPLNVFKLCFYFYFSLPESVSILAQLFFVENEKKSKLIYFQHSLNKKGYILRLFLQSKILLVVMSGSMKSISEWITPINYLAIPLITSSQTTLQTKCI